MEEWGLRTRIWIGLRTLALNMFLVWSVSFLVDLFLDFVYLILLGIICCYYRYLYLQLPRRTNVTWLNLVCVWPCSAYPHLRSAFWSRICPGYCSRSGINRLFVETQIFRLFLQAIHTVSVATILACLCGVKGTIKIRRSYMYIHT